MKNVYGTTVRTMMEQVKEDQAAIGTCGLLKDSLRVLSFDKKDKNGNMLYKRINPVNAYGRPLITKTEMMDPRNHFRITEIKHRSVMCMSNGEMREKSLLLKYNDFLICPDFSGKEGDTFISLMSDAIGGFRPDSRDELDCLYLAALLADADRDLLVGYLSDRGKHGVIHPFFCSYAPEELNLEYYINMKNAEEGMFDVTEIVKERDSALEKAMDGIWELVEKTLADIAGTEEAEKACGEKTDRFGMMQNGSVCLMQVSPCDVSVMYESSCDEGVHDYFKISPYTYKQVSDYDVFDQKSIMMTRNLRMVCGLDDETFASEQFLLSGKDMSGNTYLVAPENTIMLKRLCEMENYRSLRGDCDVTLRNLILGRIVWRCETGLLFMSGKEVHKMKNGGSIFVSNTINASGNSHDYAAELEMVCEVAASHTMKMRDWERTGDVYIARFEVMNPFTGSPASVSFPSSDGQVVTCGMEYSFSVKRAKSFKLCASFFIGDGAAMCGAPVIRERRAVSRKSKKSADSVCDLINDFFGEKGDYMNSPYAFLLDNSGIMFSTGGKNVLASMVKAGAEKYKDDIDVLLAIKRGEYKGGGRDKIIYAMGSRRVKEGLKKYTEEQIAGWSVFQYVEFVSSFATRGTDDENRGKIMAFVGRIISDVEKVS